MSLNSPAPRTPLPMPGTSTQREDQQSSLTGKRDARNPLLSAAVSTSTAHKETEQPAAFRAQALARYLGSRRLPPRKPGQAVTVTHTVVEKMMLEGHRPDKLPSVLLTVSEFSFEATETSEMGLSQSATRQMGLLDTGRVLWASEANVVLSLLQVSHVLVDQVYTRVLALISAESAATRYSTSHCHLYLFPSSKEAKSFSQNVGIAFSKLAANVASPPATPYLAPAPLPNTSSSSTSGNTLGVGTAENETRPISFLHAGTSTIPQCLWSVAGQSIPLSPTPPEQLQMEWSLQRRKQTVGGEPAPSSNCSSDGSVADFLCGREFSGTQTCRSRLTQSDKASSGYGTAESTPINTKALCFNDAAGASHNAGIDAETSTVQSNPPRPLPSRLPPSCKHPN